MSKEVPPWDFIKVLSGILEVVNEHKDYDVEYSISCGTRVMTMAAFRAALYTDSPVFFVSNPYEDEIGEIINVEPVSVALLTKQKRNILNRLDELGGVAGSQADLGSRVELGAGSISKHVNNLAAAKYVTKEKRGRETRVEITELGRIVLNLKNFRKKKVWGR